MTSHDLRDEPVQRTILSRATVHDFLSQPISEELLSVALECGCAAPNHRMTEPWGFVRVGPESRRGLLEVAIAHKEADTGAPMAANARDALTKKILGPPVLLAVTQTLSSRPDVVREDYAAVACAVQNIQLCLWSQGVGSKWGTGAVTSLPGTYELLGIDGDLQEIVGFLWIGKAERGPTKPARKRGLDSVLRTLP